MSAPEADGQHPVLMVTACATEEDVLQGFHCGADDYVRKPFSLAELVAWSRPCSSAQTPMGRSHLRATSCATATRGGPGPPSGHPNGSS